MCLLAITQYAPPYAFLVIKVIFGTVASQYAYNNFAPCLMIPVCSYCLPGKNPGTSSKVTIGILNASQNLTNLAPFIEQSVSNHPANTCG